MLIKEQKNLWNTNIFFGGRYYSDPGGCSVFRLLKKYCFENNKNRPIQKKYKFIIAPSF